MSQTRSARCEGTGAPGGRGEIRRGQAGRGRRPGRRRARRGVLRRPDRPGRRPVGFRTGARAGRADRYQPGSRARGRHLVLRADRDRKGRRRGDPARGLRIQPRGPGAGRGAGTAAGGDRVPGGRAGSRTSAPPTCDLGRRWPRGWTSAARCRPWPRRRSAAWGRGGPWCRRFGISAIGRGPGGWRYLAGGGLAAWSFRRDHLTLLRARDGNHGGRIRLPRRCAAADRTALALPAGERVVLVIVAGRIWGPRVAFLALIGWGVAATGYVLTARILGLRDSAAHGGRACPPARARRRGIDQPRRGGGPVRGDGRHG